MNPPVTPRGRERRRERTGPAPRPLLRLHRNGLLHVFVTGGSDAARREVADEFHDASPLAGGSIVHLDARRDDAVLRAALERWIAGEGLAVTTDPLTASTHGTLFVDHFAALGRPTMRLLLMLAQRPVPGSGGGLAGWGGRIVVGAPADPAPAAAADPLLTELRDCLDKIRVNLRAPAAARGPWRHAPAPREDHERRSVCG
jgi:hypothetical protein